MTTVQDPPLFGNAVNLVNAFTEASTGVTCVTKVPRDRPKRFIRTVRVGGFRRDVVTDVARIVFECWNTSSTAAERDAQMVRDLFYRARGTTFRAEGQSYKVHGVDEVAAPADNPDPDTTASRYTLTLEIHLRGRFHKETP